MKEGKNKLVHSNKNFFGAVSLTVIGIYTLTLILPLFWALMSSVKSRMDFFDNVFGWPEKMIFSNYITAFKVLYINVSSGAGIRSVYALEMMGNGVLLAVSRTLVAQASRVVSAYVVAKYRFRGQKLIYSTVIVTMILPIVGSLSSSMRVMHAIGFYDNFIGVVLRGCCFTGMQFLMYYAVFRGITDEYAYAAQIDGAGNVRILINIMLPMAMPTISALCLLSFIGNWNDYQTQMIYLPSMPVISYGLYRFQFSTSQNLTKPILLCGCLMTALPSFVLFMVFKNRIMSNVSFGGVKG